MFNWFLAQANLDTIAGGAGWVGCGILGLVLYWLFFHHLPSKDKQFADLVTGKDDQFQDFLKAKDSQIESMLSKFDAMLSQTRIDFKLTLDTITKHNQETHVGLSKVMQLELTALSKSLDGLALVVSEMKQHYLPKKKTEHA